jgi:hypothetical protein
MDFVLHPRFPRKSQCPERRYYREVYAKASLEVVETCKPLANGNEPFQWINETRIAPWTIYVLKAAK